MHFKRKKLALNLLKNAFKVILNNANISTWHTVCHNAQIAPFQPPQFKNQKENLRSIQRYTRRRQAPMISIERNKEKSCMSNLKALIKQCVSLRSGKRKSCFCLGEKKHSGFNEANKKGSNKLITKQSAASSRYKRF